MFSSNNWSLLFLFNKSTLYLFLRSFRSFQHFIYGQTESVFTLFLLFFNSPFLSYAFTDHSICFPYSGQTLSFNLPFENYVINNDLEPLFEEILLDFFCYLWIGWCREVLSIYLVCGACGFFLRGKSSIMKFTLFLLMHYY